MPPQLPDPSSLTTSSTSSSTTTSTSTQESVSRSSSTSSTSPTSSSSSSSSVSARSTSSISSSTPTTTPTIITPSARSTSATTTTPGNVATSTSTRFITTSRNNGVSPTSTVDGGGSTPFLQNTGAVVGVFTVVGLIGISLIFLLARNFRRRRRQVAFDRELQEATRQAAATSTGPFFDDDDDPYKNSYNAAGASIYGNGERQFSDMSHGTHGTYSQPPLNVDSYGMREISNPAPGDMLYSSDPYSAGAAGIGVVRARSMRTDGHQPDYSSALKDGNSPYPAFAAPNPGHMPGGGADPYANAGMPTKSMRAHRTSASAMAHSQHPYAQPHYGGSYSQGSLERNRSMDGAGQHHHAAGYGPSHATAHAVPTNRYSVVNEDAEDDAYGGVEDGVDDHTGADMAAPLPNPFERDISDARDADMDSVQGGHSQEQPKRVLKVANE